MKKIIAVTLVIATILLAIACGGNNSPKAVATKYVTALQNGDKEAAADCFYYSGTDEQKAEQRAANISLVEKGIESLKEDDGIKSFKVTNVEENGDKAVVYGTVTYGNGKTDVNDEIPTMKVDGKWYIDSNK